MTTQPHTPPMSASNEAEPDQLGVARAEGDAYAGALKAMDEESGAVTRRAGDYLVAFVQENAEGMYELEDGRLVWREAPEEANAHLEIAVADAADGRFVPALDISLTVSDGDRELFTTTMPFLWHPYLYHYGTNAKVPGEGPYTVRVQIQAPTFMRHDPVNGKRYAEPVQVTFEDRRFTPGRKPSPDAEPRGPTPATPAAEPPTGHQRGGRQPARRRPRAKKMKSSGQGKKKRPRVRTARVSRPATTTRSGTSQTTSGGNAGRWRGCRAAGGAGCWLARHSGGRSATSRSSSPRVRAARATLSRWSTSSRVR